MKLWIVWEVNVGKSELFNRFFGSYRAIVTDIAGTTRENIMELVKWNNEDYATIMDSPWLENIKEEFEYIKDIIEKSDIIVVVVDSNKSISANLEKIVGFIRKSRKIEKTILAVNKLDSSNTTTVNTQLAPFYSLWIKDIFWISAKHNIWLFELKENIEKVRISLGIDLENKFDTSIVPVAFIWRVNVGKSTLFNSILWKNWAAVSQKSGTTLDYLTWETEIKGQKYKIFDTAWYRKKGKIHWLEKIAKDKIESLSKYYKPTIVVLFDISEWVTHRDLSLLSDIIKFQLPVTIALNKQDLLDKKALDTYKKALKWFVKFASRIPVVTISWLEKEWFNDLFKNINIVTKSFNTKVSTSSLNKAIASAYLKNPPKFTKNKVVKVAYITQTETEPPYFTCFVNNKSNINFAFKKWLENAIRKEYNFVWVPIGISYKNK